MTDTDNTPHRSRGRVHFATEVTIKYQDEENTYQETYDISMNGFFVRTAKPLPLDAEGSFRLLLGVGMHRESIDGSFQVVRVISLDDGLSHEGPGAGMGLKFTSLDDDSSERLYRLIQYNQPT